MENQERFQILDNVELLCTYRVSIAVLHFLLPLTLILKNVSPLLNFDLNIYFSTSYLGPLSFLLLVNLLLSFYSVTPSHLVHARQVA